MAITPIKTLVEAAKAEIETLSQEEAEARVAAGEALFVDIRDPRERAREGYIEGAFHAPRGMLEFWAAPDSPYHKAELATDQLLILYCASAWRSALSVKTLQDMGVQGVAEMEGGFAAWKKRGAPVVEA